MRTHQSWIPNPSPPPTSTDSQPAIQPGDYKDKHSILYCHECIECSIYFKSIKTLERHKQDHHGLRPIFKCAAGECSRQFETVEDFLEHAQVHCQKNIVCLKCSIKFNSKNSLRHHMKMAHYRPTSGPNETSSSRVVQRPNRTVVVIQQPQPQSQQPITLTTSTPKQPKSNSRRTTKKTSDISSTSSSSTSLLASFNQGMDLSFFFFVENDQ